MDKRYIVRLTDEERETLQKIISTGKAPAYKIRNANILLKVDADGPNWTDEAVADAFGCHLNTVGNIRRRFVEGGLEAALARRKRHYQPRLVDGEVEAQIIALRCSAPPEGHASWTLRLLADKLVELKVVPSISHETVRKVLKKPTSSSLEGILCNSSGAEC
jgi:transposase